MFIICIKLRTKKCSQFQSLITTYQFKFRRSVLEIDEMDSYLRFKRCIFHWEQSLLRLMGHDYIAKDFKRNLGSFLLCVLVGSTVISEIYTIIYYDSILKILSLFFLLMSAQVNILVLLCCTLFHSNLCNNLKIFNSILGYHETIQCTICRWFSLVHSFHQGSLWKSNFNQIAWSLSVFSKVCSFHRDFV